MGEEKHKRRRKKHVRVGSKGAILYSSCKKLRTPQTLEEFAKSRFAEHIADKDPLQWALANATQPMLKDFVVHCRFSSHMLFHGVHTVKPKHALIAFRGGSEMWRTRSKLR